MTRPAITCDRLSKRYRIGAREDAQTFREAVVSLAAAPVRRLRRFGRSSHRERDSIWALRDVSFEVEPGEAVGVIGRNGAGKSTLLKVLSRITDPTEGAATIRGRVASLLEVGTGFHSELTGRENVHLSGAVLGMTRREIGDCFDEIVDFSGVAKFIDTPVKRYSDGMRVRLGFAVAAHLEPEILLVDEVLAVGDAEFQRKCLGKMDDVARGGRTVLLVSHNMAAIQKLCGRAILLDGGRIAASGAAAEVVRAYAEGCRPDEPAGAGHCISSSEAPPDRGARVRRIEMLDADGRPLPALHTWDAVRFRIVVEADAPVRHAGIDFGFSSPRAGNLFWYSTDPEHGLLLPLREGLQAVDCVFPRFPLPEGLYTVQVAVTRPRVEYIYEDREFATVRVHAADVFGSGFPPPAWKALFVVPHRWEPVAGVPVPAGGVAEPSAAGAGHGG
jgi:lipopolysaccharide transport system ATP-binding protein